MKRKEYLLILVLAVVAGLVGGMLSGRAPMAEPVVAQGSPQLAKVLTAEEFRLMDKDGKIRATLFIQDKDMVALWINDRNESPRARIGVVDGEGVLFLNNRAGKVMWSAP